jgi:hypothetical protein
MTTWKRDQQTAADKDKFTGPRLAKRGEHTPEPQWVSIDSRELADLRAQRDELLSWLRIMAGDRNLEYTPEYIERIRVAIARAEGRKPPSDEPPTGGDAA